MIITIIAIAILIIGIGAYYLYNYTHCDTDCFEVLGFVGPFMGGIGTFVCVLIIIIANLCADSEIADAKIEYESLCRRRDIIQSEYEDVSKTEVIKDIAEWNVEVQNAKRWGKHPLTNWFYSQKYVDSLEYIDISEI